MVVYSSCDSSYRVDAQSAFMAPVFSVWNVVTTFPVSLYCLRLQAAASEWSKKTLSGKGTIEICAVCLVMVVCWSYLNVHISFAAGLAAIIF